MIITTTVIMTTTLTSENRTGPIRTGSNNRANLRNSPEVSVGLPLPGKTAFPRQAPLRPIPARSPFGCPAMRR